MAPSANRRSGYSRRAQYTNFFGYIAAVLGLLAGAALLIVSLLDPSAFSGLRGIASDASVPAGRAAAGGRSTGQGVLATIESYFLAGSQNAKLRRELAEAKVRLVEAAATAEENRRLKALLHLPGSDPQPVAITVLTGSTATSSRRFATIAAGSNRNVRVGMPVRTPLGLIGRVLEVSRFSSRVLLLSDTESVVPGRRASDGVAVFAEGRGDGTLQLRLINLGINPLKVGDVFVTSGSGGLYRPGIALARAVRLTRDGAVAQVLSDPAASEFVIVESIWNPVEAPPPAGAPAPASSEAAP